MNRSIQTFDPMAGLTISQVNMGGVSQLLLPTPSSIETQTLAQEQVNLMARGVKKNLLEDDLENWINDPNINGKTESVRIRVACLIKECYAANSESLDLSDCTGLTSLPECLGSLAQLTTLRLSYCSDLTSLPNCLESLAQLTTLDLCGCRGLLFLPNWLGSLAQLTTLDLSSCSGLTSLPECLGRLTQLTTLNLSCCSGLTSLPNCLESLAQLTTLDLCGCRGLTSLPECLGRLAKLTTLNLSVCIGLLFLPNCLGSLTKLTTLNLSGCIGLTSLPNCLGSLAQLTTLDLSVCRGLASLPECLGSLAQLTTLDLSYCIRITSLPVSLAQLSSSCELNTDRCGLNERESLAFQDALTRARQADATRGPRWQNTIAEMPQIPDNVCINKRINSYVELFRRTFPDKDLSPIVANSFLASFSDDEKSLINLFLQRIRTTADFKNPRSQGGVLFALFNILNECAQENRTFKTEIFIPLIIEALASCGDRITITLNRMDLLRQVAQAQQNLSLKELAFFLITYKRLQLVHESAQKIVEEKKLGDAIEPMLYLQNHLKHLLKLPIVSEGMLYPAMSYITESELNEIGTEILDKTSDTTQMVEILCTVPERFYNDEGKIIREGDISVTNPFSLSIHDLWMKFLNKEYAGHFELLESDDYEMWESNRWALAKELTSVLDKK
jgi:hypothetical protein